MTYFGTLTADEVFPHFVLLKAVYHFMIEI
jgi:hypothetical protein